MRQPAGRFWLDTFFARKTTTKVPNRDLSGKTIIFTGGTDGMGRVAVMRFAEMGADICLFGRNLKKTQSLVEELVTTGAKGKFSIIECDMSSLEQVRHAADKVLDQFEHIDYLVNCAGANISEYRLSPEGYEMNFAVNYLAPFLLTELLLDKVMMTPSARIISLSSATQEAAKLDFDNLQHEKDWSLFTTYTQAKLCMIMHSRDAAKRLKGNGVTINCLNPGYIKSNIGREAKGFARIFMGLFGGLAAPTWVGGERIIAAALEEKYQSVSGQYIYEDILLEPNPIALDDDKTKQLMMLSCRMAGVTPKD